MAFTHGKDSVFTINSVTLTTFIDNVDFSRTVDVADTSTMGSESKSYLSGLSDATFSISGKYDSTSTTGPDDVLNGLVGNESAVTFEWGPEGGTTGKIKYSGSCFVTSYNQTAPVGDVVAFAADLQVTGTITRGTYS